MITLTFPAPDRRLSLNGRQHWAKKAAIAKQWRRAAWAHASSYAVTHRLHRPLPPSDIHIVYMVAANRTRDLDNDITRKHIVDGMVDAGWWPDDSAEYVLSSTVAYQIDRSRAGIVTVTITPKGTQ